ncbi:MAG: hypothetical protein R3E83_11420 [Burkholderiaceae bacterium]
MNREPDPDAPPAAAGLALPATVAVVGASSQIGQALLERLRESGYRAAPIARSATAVQGITAHVYDRAEGGFTPHLAGAEALITLAPLPTIGDSIEIARRLGARRIIAFGSPGRFSKRDSSSPLEREFVELQTRAERDLADGCEASGIGWTLLRPTMIYGAGNDLNVAFIGRVIDRLGVFPIPFGARGLRQPVHVDDLAIACVSALRLGAGIGQAYNLGGGEQLPFPELVRRIFLASGRRPRLLPVPLFAYRLAIALARRIPGAAFVRAEMVDRMFVDLIADNGPAARDLGYAPRGFSPIGPGPGATR